MKSLIHVSQRNRLQRGLTLPELLVAMVIFAIVVGFAVPSFQGTLRKQELNSQLGLITSTLAYARSEAISRRKATAICTTADQTSCLSQADWSSGWLVFVDEDADGTLDAGEEILRAGGESGGDSSLTVVADAGAPYAARFNIDGERVAGVNALSLCQGDAASGADTLHSRTITLTNVGSNRVSTGANCP
ncbi:GspH/FimT family pseudopilin [Teredinibacter turnerae]|uniref:GspH/FimT family pseudopilin n=1 Tax=Teredinibacter turnerae TaxID=2426 RepID=UPI0009B7406C|nr:GspH/FimT family pseudopilin [Teredinibacter turnerae]